MLRVYTSRNSRYAGPDKLDITAKSGRWSRIGGIVGSTFAPTWDLIVGYMRGQITEAQYASVYRAMMHKSQQENRDQWDELLHMDRVTLCCFCPPGEFCHRVLLAALLAELGAVYCGELL